MRRGSSEKDQDCGVPPKQAKKSAARLFSLTYAVSGCFPFPASFGSGDQLCLFVGWIDVMDKKMQTNCKCRGWKNSLNQS